MASKQAGVADPDVKARATARLRAMTAAQRRAFARTGRATFAVTISRKGTARLVLRASLSGRTTIVGRASRTASKAGVYRLPVRLTAGAVSALRRHHKLRLAATLTFTGQRQPRHLVVDLVSKGR